MKKLTALFVVVLAVAFSSNLFAQNTATVGNASASAKIITKITLANATPLNFGIIAQTTAGGTVTLNANSDVAVHSNTAAEIQSSTEARAIFNVAGEANALYSISLPSSSITLTRASGSETMTVNGFTTDNSTTGSQIEANGTDSFYVGAVLNVGANQVAGTYNGTYSVTVAYN